MTMDNADDLQHRVDSLEMMLAQAVCDLRRLKKQEQRRRSLFIVTVLAAICIVAIGVTSAPATGALGAQGPLTVSAPFKVVNSSGEVVLAVNEGETDFFQHYVMQLDRDGNQTILLNASGKYGVPELVVGSKTGPAVMLSSGGDGYGDIEAYGPSKKVYFSLGAHGAPFTGASLQMYSSAEDRPIIGLGDFNGSGLVEAKKANEASWAALGTDEQGYPGLRIRKNGKLTALLGFNAAGKTALKLYGEQATPVAALGENPDGPGGILQINDDAGMRAVEVRDHDVGGQVAVFPHSNTAFVTLSTAQIGGQVAVANSSGQTVSILDTSVSQGGRLILSDTSGGPVVKAGWNGSGGEICAATAKRGTQCIDISVPLQMR